MLNVKPAAPLIREKIPRYTRQPRSWLIQALGALGDPSTDVPFIADYLEDMSAGVAAAEAIQEMTGVSFGHPTTGLSLAPSREVLAAQAWWASHKDKWPDCDDCNLK